MPAEVLLRYVKNGLSATPIVLTSLNESTTPAELDNRPDPDRFTLREAMAHLADWEPIWKERIGRIRDESFPTLPDRDEEQMAIDNDYAHHDFDADLARFVSDRRELAATLATVTDEEWLRTAYREHVGEVTLFDSIVLILAHDAYHLRQFAEFRRLNRS